MLEVRGLSKTYRSGPAALSDVSFDMEEGVLGLLGPNGAGKTTLLSILATVTKPSGGTFSWQGRDAVKDPFAVRRVLGYLPAGLRRLRAPHGARVPPLPRASQGPLGRRAREPRRRPPDAREPPRRRGPSPRRVLGRHATARRDRAGPPRRPEARHRGRADRRPRSGGARAVPQPPRGDRARKGRDPLDAHRVGRRGGRVEDRDAVGRAAARNRDARGSPRARGRPRLHGRRRPPGRVASVQARVPVSGMVRRADGVHVRYVGHPADVEGARPAEPTLEDAYLFSTLDGAQAA